ncbi:hypothetical protein, partial [Aquitalea palustris]|uniref:hypothetical protein n=1 Tax=Aquitalea palustris TaxID=2480983 RepID=UPI001F1B845B
GLLAHLHDCPDQTDKMPALTRWAFLFAGFNWLIIHCDKMPHSKMATMPLHCSHLKQTSNIC